MKNTVLRYGIIGGLMMVVLGMINWYLCKPLGYMASQIGGYVFIILSLSTIYFGIRHYRDELLGGRIRFGQAFSTGLLIALIPSVFMFFYTMLFFKIWGAEFQRWAMDEFQKQMSAKEFALMQQQIEANRALYENLAFQGFIMFATVLLIGVVIALLSAMLLKRDKAGVA